MGNTSVYGHWVSLSPFSTHRHENVPQLKSVRNKYRCSDYGIMLGFLWRQNCKKHISIDVSKSLNVGH